MSEEGDTPNVDEVVQSTSMTSLNEEIAPKTDNKKSVFQRVGSLIGGKKSKDKITAESEEDLVAQLMKERDRYKASDAEKKELITKMECEAKLQYAEIKKLKSEREYEAKLKAKEIENLKMAHQKSQAEMGFLITKMECDAKLKLTEIENFKREVDNLNDTLQAKRDEIDRCKNELRSKDSRIIEMEHEIKSASVEFENLKVTFTNVEVEWKARIDKMEWDVNSKAKEIEYLQKMEYEWKSRISQLEKEVEAAKKWENLNNSGDVTHGLEKVEKNLRSLLDRPSEMTIRWRFDEISNLSTETIFSQSTKFAGVTWRIGVGKSDSNYLALYLEGKKFGAAKWSCTVVADFQLLSQKDNSIVEQHSFSKPRVYDEASTGNGWGKPKFLIFEDLLKGDAVEDDSILVAVDINVFHTN